jgi:hypothetical protein
LARFFFGLRLVGLGKTPTAGELKALPNAQLSKVSSTSLGGGAEGSIGLGFGLALGPTFPTADTSMKAP